MELIYHTNSHSKYLIKLHFVIATKYRKSILKGFLKDDIKQIVFDVCNDNKWIIDQMESDNDHLHILLDILPKFSAMEVISKIKQITTYRIYQKHKEFLKKHYWKENTLWSDGYFVCSTGDANTETIKRYIAEQG